MTTDKYMESIARRRAETIGQLLVDAQDETDYCIIITGKKKPAGESPDFMVTVVGAGELNFTSSVKLFRTATSEFISKITIA